MSTMSECSEKSEESEHAALKRTQFSLAKDTPRLCCAIFGNYFLLAGDAFYKWPEFFLVNRITTSKTLSVLRKIFVRFGFPMILVSDNGPTYRSKEFSDFLKSNGIP